MLAEFSKRNQLKPFLCPLLLGRVFARTLHLLLVCSAATLLIGVRAWDLPSSRHTPMTVTPRRTNVARLVFVRPRQGTSLAHFSSRSPDSGNPDNPAEDEACMGGSDEEECEIDWSKMPGFAEDDDDNPVDTALVSSVETNDEDFDELRLLLERQFQAPTEVKEVVAAKPSAITDQSSSTMQSDWQRLEMMWQQREAASECDVYEPVTCGGHVCPTCSGSGASSCRFCRGTKFLYLPITHDNSVAHLEDSLPQVTKPTSSSPQPFVSCSICHASGVETCRSCQGSGWIADWTQMGVRVGSRNMMPPSPPSAWLE